MEAVRCTHIHYVTYVNALHTGNAGLQGSVFHSGVVVSVLLTSCVKAISLPDNTLPPPGVQNGKVPKKKKKKRNPEVTVAFGLLVLHESPSDVQTVCCSASTRQRYRSDQHLGTCNRTTWTLN